MQQQLLRTTLRDCKSKVPSPSSFVTKQSNESCQSALMSLVQKSKEQSASQVHLYLVRSPFFFYCAESLICSNSSRYKPRTTCKGINDYQSFLGDLKKCVVRSRRQQSHFRSHWVKPPWHGLPSTTFVLAPKRTPQKITEPPQIKLNMVRAST